MSNIPHIFHRISHQTISASGNPTQTLQTYIHRSNTQQSVIDFKFASIIDINGNLNNSIAESMEYMLDYHEIHQPDSTYFIEETKQYIINEIRANTNILATDLQVTLTIKDYNPNAAVRLDVDLIISNLENTITPPTTEEANEMCIVCFGNYYHDNHLRSLTCGHTFHFACIDQWLRRNISCLICMEYMLDYHEIHQPDSTYLIEETKQYIINEIGANTNILATNLQVTLTIKDYNPNAAARLDVDLIISDLENTITPPTLPSNEMCIVCFGNYYHDNHLRSLTCDHNFHFAYIDQWLRRNISCPICRENNL